MPDDTLDVDAMLARFRDPGHGRARAAPPPVAGPERARFVEQAKLDYLDFSMLADAAWEFHDGVLTLRVDLRPPRSGHSRSSNAWFTATHNVFDTG